MANYIVYLKLTHNKRYKRLFEKLKAFDSYVEILNGCWAIVTKNPVHEVRNSLLDFIYSGDGIFIISSGDTAAWGNIKCSDDWLQVNLGNDKTKNTIVSNAKAVAN